MDLFTHVLVAYLVTFGVVGFQPQYLAAGALAGGLPDGDALLYPLSRRFPILRHHGITHSVFGVTLLAVAGALIAPLLLPGSPLIYFAVMMIGGCAHILQDAFTNFSVPPLLPFSKRRVNIDADRAINFTTLVVSVVALYVLLGVERNQVPMATYLATVYVLGAFFAAYFALRLFLRFWLGSRLASLGDFTNVVPTGSPFVWLLLSERKDPARMRTSVARYVLGRPLQGPYVVDVALGPPPPPSEGPLASSDEALERSYPLIQHRSRFLEDSYHFGEAVRTEAGGWVATWYSLEYALLGRTAAVEVRFPADGGVPTVRETWRRIVMPWNSRT